MKKITINQFHSIGDILFIEPIVRYLRNNNYSVDLPVRDHLMWIADYFDNPEVFSPMSKNKDFVDHHFIKEDYLPLRFANQVLRGYDLNDHHDFENMMLDKYQLFNQQFLTNIDWKTIKLNLNLLKCKEVEKYYNIDSLKENFIIVNNHSQAGSINIDLDTDKKVIYMQQLHGYTLIDWATLLIHSSEIHTVSTSIVFLLQALHNQGFILPPVFIYPRPNEDGLRGIQNLKFTYNYKLVY